MPESSEKNYTDSFKQEINSKLRKATVLRDYAIENSFEIQNETLDSLNSIQESIIKGDNLGVGASLDKVMKSLSQLLYPTNYESILITKNSFDKDFNIKKFRNKLLYFSILFLTIGISAYAFMDTTSNYVKIYASVLSGSLGALGALVYIIFNLIGILNESAFNAQDTFSNYARIILGTMLGWIFYFGFAQGAFLYTTTNDNNYIYLLIPFLVGFSTKLVVGILNQLIKAFELILGIDNKDVDILTRRKNKKPIKN